MEITKYIVFSIVLHLQMFHSHATGTMSVKGKRSSIKPHGRHVANKRGWSTLFDTRGGNQTLPNVSPVAVVSTLGNAKQQERRIASFRNTVDKKTRRKKKKHTKRMMRRKIREDLDIKSRIWYPKRKCRNWSECKKDECCIRYSATKGFCKRRPQKGDKCKPILLPGLKDCPCDTGLTCTRYKTAKYAMKKHRCERLNGYEDEVDQRYA